MEKVSGHTRLWRRGAAYYFRAKVPVDLLKHYSPKLEIKFSLKTNDRKEAERRVRLAAVKLDEEFAAIRNGPRKSPARIVDLSPAQVQAIGNAWLAHWLDQDEQARARGLTEAEFENIEAWTISELVDDWRAALITGDTQATTEEARERIAETLPHGSTPTEDAVRRVAFELVKQRIEYWSIICDRQRGIYRNTTPTPAAPAPQPHADPHGPLPMSEAFDRWNAERKLPEKTLAEFRRFHAAFRKMHGDLAIAEVTRKHIVAFKDALIVDGKAPKTVIKQVSALRAMLEWAFHNDHIQSNPASRIKIAAPKVRKEKRLPYDAADLKRIFSSSIYTEGLRPRAGGGEAAYWLPLLALFTGARVEELAQALPGDIREEDGVPVLDITDREEGKRVKTTSSRRRVPLHRELVRLGFLDYAEKMRAAKKVRLFPALVPDKWQACSGNFSKWWGRFARSKLGISDERKVFHSFRHSFKEACRACGINEEVHDALTGHSGGGVGRSYGGQNYPLVPLSAAIGCLQFKGIEVIQRLQKAAH